MVATFDRFFVFVQIVFWSRTSKCFFFFCLTHSLARASPVAQLPLHGIHHQRNSKSITPSTAERFPEHHLKIDPHIIISRKNTHTHTQQQQHTTSQVRLFYSTSKIPPVGTLAHPVKTKRSRPALPPLPRCPRPRPRRLILIHSWIDKVRGPRPAHTLPRESVSPCLMTHRSILKKSENF